MCWADPGCCWVLETQVMQNCTQSSSQPRLIPALGWKGVGMGDRKRSLAERLGTPKWG